MVRGGYGIFFDSAEGREIDGAADIYPYVSRGSYTQTLGQTDRSDDGPDVSEFCRPGPATPAANSFLAVSMSPEPRNPYVQQWSFGIQRALSGNSTLELNYIGNKGTHLLMRRQINQSCRALGIRRSARRIPPPADCPCLPEGLIRTSASISTATGPATPATTRSMPALSIAAVAALYDGLYMGEEHRQQIRCRRYRQ